MYWGSNYCSGCKYNRTCYVQNLEPYEYGTKGNCIIARMIFEEKYRKENKIIQ